MSEPMSITANDIREFELLLIAALAAGQARRDYVANCQALLDLTDDPATWRRLIERVPQAASALLNEFGSSNADTLKARGYTAALITGTLFRYMEKRRHIIDALTSPRNEPKMKADGRGR